ncbi:MAG: hypothetical protein LAP38_20925 [Acidobacteriia bacterium]|nr:hypothetical protein [Terriglobia bacterium]
MLDLFAVLIRHFFGRFFDNELVSPEGEMHSSIGKIIALLVSPGMVCFWLLPKYTYLSVQPHRVFEAGSLSDKLFFLTFSVVVMGFVTVLEWDALFPDRRDFTILVPLPIRLPVIFAAKIVSLCAFVLLFFATTNAISMLFYPLTAVHPGPSFLDTLDGIRIHATAVMAATVFVFLFFVAVQGLLMNVLSYRLFQRASTYVQLFSVLALLLMLLLFLDTSSLLHSFANRRLLYFFPPMWFLGLYETMLGEPEPLAGCRQIALRALAAVVTASAVAYLLSYKRHVKRSLESEEIFDVVPSWLSSGLSALANRLLVRNPLEQASFYFAAKTIVRSRKHWLYLAAYVGVGFALVLQGLVGAYSRSGGLAIGKPTPTLLSIPLILSFFVLSGMRVIFAIPAELKANWVFRLSEADGRKECLAGVRKAMFVFGVLPLFGVLLPVYIFLWGWADACFHTFFCLVLSFLLIELLLFRFRKIPFTCSYLPGKAQLTTRWVFYWMGFAVYAYTMASLEQWFLKLPIRMAGFYLLGWAVIAATMFYRNRMLDQGFALVFEEQPEPIVHTLNLSTPGSW